MPNITHKYPELLKIIMMPVNVIREASRGSRCVTSRRRGAKGVQGVTSRRREDLEASLPAVEASGGFEASRVRMSRGVSSRRQGDKGVKRISMRQFEASTCQEV